MIRFTGVPKYTVAQLEQQAEFLLKQRCGWPPELPVDIELLVDREPGMLLDILPGFQQVAAVAGLVRYEPKLNNFRLIIDADVADHPAASFYRFTVAEEFAHVLLHRRVMEQVGTLEDLQSLHEWSGYEEIDWTRADGEYVVSLLNECRAAWALIRQWTGHDPAIAQPLRPGHAGCQGGLLPGPASGGAGGARTDPGAPASPPPPAATLAGPAARREDGRRLEPDRPDFHPELGVGGSPMIGLPGTVVVAGQSGGSPVFLIPDSVTC